MRQRGTMFKKYRVFLVVGSSLCWWGSYTRLGNARHCLRESGPGLRAMKVVDGDTYQWQVQVDGELREATLFESRLLDMMAVISF